MSVKSTKISAETGWHVRLPKLSKPIVLKMLERLDFGELTLIDDQERLIFKGSQMEADPIQAVIEVTDPGFYSSLIFKGSIGAAEAYIKGEWQTPDLINVVRLAVKNLSLLENFENRLARLAKPFLSVFHYFNKNTLKGSKRNIEAHYDLGNDFFQLFLDETNMYSSAIFPSKTATLTEASRYKLDLICQKLNLSPEDEVLEIGTGWGGFAMHATRYYGCKVTTTTLSDEQFKHTKAQIASAGLSNRITLLKQDYRALRGRFDKIVSIEMIEAVGHQYYNTFFNCASKLLKEDGLILIQSITIPEQRYEQAKKSVDFIQRYIFPGSCIPSNHALLSAASQTLDFRLVHQEDFSSHYGKTLTAWLKNFKANQKKVQALGYSAEFCRMWAFYLCYCAGGFFERSIGVAHLMFAKPCYKNEPMLKPLKPQLKAEHALFY